MTEQVAVTTVTATSGDERCDLSGEEEEEKFDGGDTSPGGLTLRKDDQVVSPPPPITASSPASLGPTSARVLRGQIGFAGQQSLFSGGVADDFMIALTSGIAEVERYRRTWRLGRIERRPMPQGDVIFSRLGFQGRDQETAVWDATSGDWVAQDVPRGEIVTFAVRLSDLRLAFQVTSAIKAGSFVGALEALLNRELPDRPWVVELGTTRPSYAAWRQSVRRIVRARGTLETPNPHWRGREKFETFFEDFHVEEARLDLKFDEDAPAEAVDEVVSQMVDHAERGYGSTVVVGESAQDGGQQVEYRTEVEQAPVTVPVDEHGEATWTGLEELLEENPEEVQQLDPPPE